MVATVAFAASVPSRRAPQPRRRAHKCPPSASAVPPPLYPASRLAALAERARSLKCPFFRRRSTDAVEAVAATLAWIATVRHKSLDLEFGGGQAVGVGSSPRERQAKKRRGLACEDFMGVIEKDFVERQYYVTGRLSEGVYRDDCVFDGPDPDVPVRGLRKYCDATKGLFFRPESRVELLEIGFGENGVLEAHWRLEGMLNLPWKPKIKAYTGSTKYFRDNEGLVERHEETWAISALDAFTSTLFPRLGFGAPEAPGAEALLDDRQRKGTDFDAYARARIR